MLFPVSLLIPVAASVALYFWFQKQDGGKRYWLIAAAATGVVASARMGFVASGVYLLENASGWVQLPAYAMALCGLPEALLLARPIDRSAEVLIRLAALLLAGSGAWVFAIAGLAARAKHPSRPSA